MIIHLFGPDSYRRLKKEQEIIASFREKNTAANVSYLDLSTKEAEEKLEEFTATTGLFSNRNLAILSNIEKVSAQTIKLLKSLVDNKQTTAIAIAEKKLSAKFAFLTKKPAISQEFTALKERELLSFVKAEAKERSYTLKQGEAEELISLYESDLWEIGYELEKRALGSKEVNKKQEKLDFFPAVNALRGQMPVGQKLRILDQILKDEEPAAVFNLMAALSKPDKKPAMANYDIAVKSGKLDYPEILLSIVLK